MTKGPEVIRVHIPYSGIEFVIVDKSCSANKGLPRAQRTLTHLQRYQLKEMCRVGAREDNGIISHIENITGRSQIGKVRI